MENEGVNMEKYIIITSIFPPTEAVEKLYTHSHYCEKNGRWDWWPCGVYQKYRRVERYCADCGKRNRVGLE